MEETQTKDKILKGAADLFTKYGIRSISMDDIARHLSVSKKTLYQHFVDKDELVTMVTQAHLKANQKIYDDINKQSENSIDELHKIGLTLRRHIEEQNPSLLFDIQKFHPKAWSEWVEYKNNFIHSSIVRNIEQGIKDGHIREVNAEIFAQLRVATIQLCCDEQIFPRDKFNVAEVQSLVFEHFVFGLCTEKGKKLYQKYKENNHKQLSNEAVI
ncbi:MAG: TetR/AcrR family transcriptional regulator [Bacteroidetes bacterium]|nr:TetR/AcrR family transcriptional regulator [Bacteroidota bacterium]MBI3482587.1 TetR/AcrR family transcriptional regulator [Bacteroidota bacterium]